MMNPLSRFRRKEWRTALIVLLGSPLLLAMSKPPPEPPVTPGPPFVAFESGHVRPVAMSPDKTKLFAVNTPNNTLEIFNITAGGLSLLARVPVGIEPVAVAARSDSEVWVVNHLSDSVSVVSLDGTPRVVRTLLVGDEPRDIVFAGSDNYAFIATAHRGQHRIHPSIAHVPGAGDPQLTTPSIGRADVWVFDPADLGAAVGGIPSRIMTFFSDKPRALAVSPDNQTVYVAAMHSGNQTTTVIESMVCDGFKPFEPCRVDTGDIMPGGNPGPATNFEGKPAPEVGLIVKFNNETLKWEDELGRDWSKAVRFRLPDLDVFAIDANRLSETASYAHVGTTLFNMITNPKTGKLYVSNTESFNHVRFEGPGVFGGSTVAGHLAEVRVTVISRNNVTPRHLNKHIDYSKLPSDPSFDWTMKEHSLSAPLGMAVTGDGKTLYVAAFGSSKIGVFDTAALEHDTFNPRIDSANYITVSGGGPSGMVLDEARGRMYVMTRFDNAVKVIDLDSKIELAQAVLPNPEPESIVTGRHMLYDADKLSANGESSCASCHMFGDKDELAWDLGDPDAPVTTSPIPQNLTSDVFVQLGKLLFGVESRINGSDNPRHFHSMKGPMVTQTLRGLRNSGAMHWRGDRAVGPYGVDAFDPELSFKNFIVAFPGLVGSGAMPSDEDMQAFADFQLQVQMPPNPVRRLDNSLTPAQQRGMNFYDGRRPSDGIEIPILGGLILGETAFTCEGCHRLSPEDGFFGTGGNQSFEGITQIVKIPQLRNMYDKVGMFGTPKVDFFGAPDTGFMGDQIRGFGFVHDGSVDTMFRFFTAVVFNPTLNSGFPLINPNATRRDVVELMLAFDSDLAPVVGQQVTLTSNNSTAVGPRIDLLIQRAETPFTSKELGGTVRECDLVASVAYEGSRRGFVYDAVTRDFVAGDGSSSLVDAELRALAATPGQEVTYTCAPPGSGPRMAAL